MRKIAPALAHGNAIVLKPSEFSPATACIIADLGRGVLPDGLLGIVLGKASTGQALVSHPLTDAVTFTGSVPTGCAIYQLAARSLAEVSLELGGKNPIVIHDTDDLDACLDEAITGALNNAGQRCTAVSRVLVQNKLAADVEAGLAQRMRSVVVGNGFHEGSRIGPLAMKAQFEKVASMVDKGVAEGARVAAGGRRLSPAGWESGYFMAPTLLCGVTPDMSVAREEIFGPVLSVLPYEHIEDALELVNDVQFGLAASLFSNDQRVVNLFIDHAEAGMLHINNQTATDPNMPFIGVKDSGVGACSVGQGASSFYSSERAVYLRYGK
jgi:aldehyde dehydrogenase (NAD+)